MLKIIFCKTFVFLAQTLLYLFCENKLSENYKIRKILTEYKTRRCRVPAMALKLISFTGNLFSQHRQFLTLSYYAKTRKQ